MSVIANTSTDRHDEVGEGWIFTVQLRSGANAKRAFLKRLQSALGADAEIGSLLPGPSADVYLLPGTTEQTMRDKFSNDDAVLEARLRGWGALTVNQLDRDVLFALLQRGAIVLPGGAVIGDSKVSAPDPQRATRAPPTNALPTAFVGPFDWNLGPRGANVVAAWDMFAQVPAHGAQLPWKDIRIGHIDTGYTEHAALGWENGQSPTVIVGDGNDYWTPDHDARDDWLPGFPGHGTRISAAFAGFLPGAPGRPFYGVAPGAQVVPYRVTDSVIVDHVKKHIANAIREAVADGCQVINISLGALFGYSKLAEALDFAYDNGVIVNCAAGQVWREVIYPGRYNRCNTMGGVGPDFKPWSSSAIGQYVDLCGPADQIRRVKAEKLPPGTAAQTIHAVADGDGTSYATATCSGVAALWLAWHGAAALRTHYARNGAWQIPAAFKRLARATATPGDWPVGSPNHGSGVINAAALLAAALPADGTLTKAKKAADVFDPND